MHDRLPSRIDFRILAPQLVLGLALIAASDSHLVELSACLTRRRCAQTGFLEGFGRQRIRRFWTNRRQSGSYRDVLASREDTRLASLGALGVRVATHDPVWHSSVIAITSEPLGETTRLAQFSLDPFLAMNSIPIVAISPWWSTISSTGSIHAEHSQGSRRTDR